MLRTLVLSLAVFALCQGSARAQVTLPAAPTVPVIVKCPPALLGRTILVDLTVSDTTFEGGSAPLVWRRKFWMRGKDTVVRLPIALVEQTLDDKKIYSLGAWADVDRDRRISAGDYLTMVRTIFAVRGKIDETEVSMELVR